MTALVVGAVVAVLTGADVLQCDTSPARVVRSVRLPAVGAAIFAAPDGRLLVPLAGEDATLVVDAAGVPGRWAGRLFPLFFDEADRLHAVMPDAVVTLSYPDRLPLLRTRLPAGFAPWRAAVSRDGRLVAVLAADRRELVVVVSGGEVPPARVGLPRLSSAVAVGPNAEWVLVGLESGEVMLVDAVGTVAATSLALGAAPVALAAGASGRDALAVTRGTTGSAVVSIRIKPASASPLKEVARVAVPGAAITVAAAGTDAVVLTDAGLAFFAGARLSPRGRLAIAGARDLAVVPAVPVSLMPRWDDAASP